MAHELDAQVTFGEVDVSGMVNLVRQSVFGGKPASVVQRVLVLLALHPTAADTAVQQAAEHVVMLGDAPLPVGSPGTVGGEHLLGLVEGLGIDEWFMGEVGGPDSGVFGVPAHLGDVTQGDIPHLTEVGDDELQLLIVEFICRTSAKAAASSSGSRSCSANRRGPCARTNLPPGSAGSDRGARSYAPGLSNRARYRTRCAADKHLVSFCISRTRLLLQMKLFMA